MDTKDLIIRKAWYKAAPKDFYGNAIATYTGFFNSLFDLFKFGKWIITPQYCHQEIGFKVSDVRACLAANPYLEHPALIAKLESCKDDEYIWYSSASRNADGTNGTRWISETDLFKNPERWDVYEMKAIIPLEKMLYICNDEIGKAYDWLGIMGFGTIFGQVNDKKKWYCSEICKKIFSGKWTKRISPIASFIEDRPMLLNKVKI